MSEPARKRGPVKIDPWARWISGIIGAGGLGAGGVATFTRSVEAGPVGLIAVGTLFLFVALSGALPTRIKIGDNEAEWARDVEESVERIEQKLPEVGVLLDTGGASLETFLEGGKGTDERTLARAGLSVGSIAEDVRFIVAKAGEDRVPREALLEIAKWQLAQQDWGEAARYLEAYVRRGDADWEVYFSLGVAHANRRQGSDSDRASLRAYNNALRLMPSGRPTPLTARLYSYRAAVEKRLGRLQEAKADAEVAKQLAVARYDRTDATYNLACVEAMLGNREAAMVQLRELDELGGLGPVRGHLEDYFGLLAGDAEFRGLLGLGHM